ncbi:terpenoid cyclases/Protein prenyltransferase [Melanomma pulvis-pyrius CBS 109.77]|uniref:Protein farnesyltransferase subunit beta n=1 Tax=Melanomma pulvis-pyrius CBS 109.77 TaxID=1314802 RepID=A0A6A6WNF8_9PLEO|nr:terpenoid cyclases/Protein prenyltransferase [Melanomma pulvis-pyrius CBS 109.77]
MADPGAPSSTTPSSRLDEILSAEDRVEELSDSENNSEYEDMGPVTEEELANTAYIKSVTSPIRDALQTETSKARDETLEVVLPFLESNPNEFELNIFRLPKLQRAKHVQFLKNALGDYPSQFAMMDAARPWLLYWSLQGLTALSYDISEYQERVIHTFSSAQHPTGGYGGGFGQLPHLAPTYAAILSLVMVGGRSAYDSIDRKTMWHYLGRMKQADGGFTMSPGGEEDIRGAFCALVIMSLLNLPLELPPDSPARGHGHSTFLDNLGDWVSRCQTYEGGISAAPGNEAHGAYAFCGLGCLSIMGPPKETLNKHLNIPLLIHWLSSRQCAPEGGYNGRTNKLVDGCYSHWIGGCWSLIEASTSSATPSTSLWNRSALGRYILSAAQFKKGGLVDKPGKRPDAYHSCYNLAGLSAAQHFYGFDEDMEGEIGKGDLNAPYHWKKGVLYEGEKVWDEEEGDAVEKIHPVFVIPWDKVEECRGYFEGKEGF